MVQLRGERHRGVHAFNGLIRKAHEPQGEGGGRQAGDARIVPHAGTPEARWELRKQRNRPIEVVEAGPQIGEEHQRRAHDEVPVDQHPRIVLAFGEREDLPTQRHHLVELGAEVVQADQPSEHGELLARVRAAFEQVHRAGQGVLGFGGVALCRDQGPGQARSQRDLLADPFG